MEKKLLKGKKYSPADHPYRLNSPASTWACAYATPARAGCAAGVSGPRVIAGAPDSEGWGFESGPIAPPPFGAKGPDGFAFDSRCLPQNESWKVGR